MKTVNINSIQYGVKLPRNIIIVGNTPFYCSSGYNSGYEGTYFPFLGMCHDIFSTVKEIIEDSKKLSNLNEVFLTKDEVLGGKVNDSGWFIKPSILNDGKRKNSSKKGKIKGDEVYSFHKNLDKYLEAGLISKNIAIRFGSEKLMVLSCILGGGFWNTKQGNELGDILKSTFNTSYIYKINKPSKIFAKDESGDNLIRINLWIKENRGYLLKKSDLANKDLDFNNIINFNDIKLKSKNAYELLVNKLLKMKSKIEKEKSTINLNNFTEQPETILDFISKIKKEKKNKKKRKKKSLKSRNLKDKFKKNKLGLSIKVSNTDILEENNLKPLVKKELLFSLSSSTKEKISKQLDTTKNNKSTKFKF